MQNLELFKVRGKTPVWAETVLQIKGVALLILVWWLIKIVFHLKSAVLPSPLEVVFAFGELWREWNLRHHIMFSLFLNVGGYIGAVLAALPIGYLLGLFPFFRHLSARPVAAFRFLPLPALTGLFILWLGLSWVMKISFLGFGIFIYLLPAVILRVAAVDEVLVQTGQTMGASTWQNIRHVFIPAAMSKIFDDVTILVAISWTYSTVIEPINSDEGGLGALIQETSRQSHVNLAFAALAIILTIGFIQDKFMKMLDQLFFPYKYE